VIRLPPRRHRRALARGARRATRSKYCAVFFEFDANSRERAARGARPPQLV